MNLLRCSNFWVNESYDRQTDKQTNVAKKLRASAGEMYHIRNNNETRIIVNRSICY